MSEISKTDVEEFTLETLSKKEAVLDGDVFMDLKKGYVILTMTLSDSYGERYVAKQEGDRLVPDGMVADSELLDPTLFRFMYNVMERPKTVESDLLRKPFNLR